MTSMQERKDLKTIVNTFYTNYAWHLPTIECILWKHHIDNGCFLCCVICDLDEHKCYGCGTPLTHDGYETVTMYDFYHRKRIQYKIIHEGCGDDNL